MLRVRVAPRKRQEAELQLSEMKMGATTRTDLESGTRSSERRRRDSRDSQFMSGRDVSTSSASMLLFN